MSSVIHSQASGGGYLAADLPSPEHVPPGRAFTVLRRRKWGLLLFVVVVTAIAGSVIFDLPSFYDAQSVLMVDTRKTQFSDLQASAIDLSAESLTLRTQTDILMSASMAGRVVDRLDLVHLSYVQQALHAPPNPQQRITRWVRDLIGQPEPAGRDLTAAEQRQVALAWLLDRLTVSNDGRSYLITVKVRTPDPALSARIANAYADIYIDFNRQLKVHAIQRANGWLDQQIAPLKDRLRRAENAVEQYREANGLVVSQLADPETGQVRGSTVADQQLRELNTQLTEARNELSTKLSHLREAQAALKSGGGLESVPEVVASPLIQRLRQQETELTGKEAGLGQTALARNPALRTLQASGADLRRRITAEVAKIVSSLRAEASASQAHVDALQQRFAQVQTQVVGQSQAGVTLQQLVSEATAARAVYRDYLGRYEQTSSQAALQEPEADLIAYAEAPLGPAGPPRSRIMALAVAAAGILGALIALGLDRLRGGMRTAEQLQAETGLFPLGFVPVGGDPKNTGTDRRPSGYAEAISHVRTMLRFGHMHYRARVVLVTSATPREGKTFFAVSLAASVVRDGGRALLIDADVRRPNIARSLGMKRRPPARTDDQRLQAELRQNVMPGLDILTFSSSGGVLTPPDPEQMRSIVNEARDRYDMLVIDTPPVLAVADAARLASVADGAIMVVRWASTPAVTVRSALRTLQAYDARVIGGVLTQVNLKELNPAEGGHAHLYSSSPGYFRS